MAGSFEYETFGINRARVATYGSYPPTWLTIPITQEGTVTVAVSKAEVADGEGDIDYVWRHSQRCSVKLKAGKQSMRILEAVSGNNVSSVSGTEAVYFGTEGETTPPVVLLELVCVATDPANATPTRVYQTMYLFKCQVKFPDIQFGSAKPGEIELEFDAYKSNKDDLGRTIPVAFGRLVAGATALP